LSEAFLGPIFKLGYSLENHKWELGPQHEASSMSGYALHHMSQEAPSCTVFRSSRDDDAPYYALDAEPEGGGGKLLSFDGLRSIEAARDTKFDLSYLNGSLVLGIGWDPLRNKTYELLHGAGAHPDIDVCVYPVRDKKSER
jgi:hypothetical protein